MCHQNESEITQLMSFAHKLFFDTIKIVYFDLYHFIKLLPNLKLKAETTKTFISINHQDYNFGWQSLSSNICE